MRRKTVTVAIGTRPEAIKLFPVVRALCARTTIRVRTVLSGQQSDISGILHDFGIGPDDVLSSGRKDGDPVRTLAGLLSGFGACFLRHHPDYVLVQGDTLTSLAAGMAAFYSGIPFGHIEAGLRSPLVLRPFPEEADRRLLSAVADLHFCPTREAERNLLQENVPSGSITVTGNTGIDALRILERSFKSDHAFTNRLVRELERLAGRDVFRSRTVLVTCHRRENRGVAMRSVCSALRILARRHPETIFLFPVHPNPAAGPVKTLFRGADNIRVLPPLDYPGFVFLIKNAYFVITDSGGLQEEAPALGKAVILMRDETERTEAVSAGAVVLAGTGKDRLVAAVEKFLLRHPPIPRKSWANLYGSGRSAERIVRVLERRLNLPGKG